MKSAVKADTSFTGFDRHLTLRRFRRCIHATARMAFFRAPFAHQTLVFKRLGFGAVHPIAANRLKLVGTCHGVAHCQQQTEKNDCYWIHKRSTGVWNYGEDGKTGLEFNH